MQSLLKSFIKRAVVVVLSASTTLLLPSISSAEGAKKPALETRTSPGTTPKSTYVYTSYIKATPAAVWETLTTSDTIRQVWAGATIESDWKVGAPWKLVLPDGRVADAGEIVEFEPAKRLVFKWRNEIDPERKAEGYSHCTYDIEQGAGATKLTVTHEIDGADSKFIRDVSNGWPLVISNVKSLLETGSPATGTTDRK